ncbi:MAG TPA: DNA mismatch repair endonuclease MutL [Verrucomicrobiae bacterium]
MNRIRLLPEHVANQIAAGEVIERPASVVKELVENALDAQARRVTIEIQAGGRSLIRVIDDGIGMSRDDALLCLERHATSKIRRAEDLAAVATMGFRGEALPSIASVSRFTLTTRERDADAPEGTQILINAGRILEVKAAGSASGTTVEVRHLFSNLPARRKFLRTEQTESAHIDHYLTLAALAYPGVGFTFQRDGKVVWQLPALETSPDLESRLSGLRQRLRALSGGEQKLVAVNFSAALPAAAEPEELDEGRFETARPANEPESAAGKPEPEPDLRVWGFIGGPGVSRATREDQHLYVNKRPVENRGLNFALLEGYHTALMKGRYPVACLFLEIDPSEVDVNIHPAKREVKFHREMEVRRLVTQAIRRTLFEFHAAGTPGLQAPGASPAGSGDNGSSATAAAAAFPRLSATQEQKALPNFPTALSSVTGASQLLPPTQAPLRMGFGSPSVPSATPGRPQESEAENRPAAGNAPLRPGSPASLPEPRDLERVSTRPQPLPEPAPVALLSVPLRLLGVVGKLYVILESDRGLVLLDQHAAHERVLFEQMLNRLERDEQAPSQKLLLPETVELSAKDANFVREQLPVLTRLGVGLSEFGERTFLLDALPPFAKAADPRRFVLEIVDELKATGQEVNSFRLGEHTVAKTVCRHAVKAHDPLAGTELEALIEDLRHCAMPYTCPHGRPTLIEMNFRELEKKFGRVV